MTGAADQAVRCAIVGYGRNWNFGRMHGRWIGACPGLHLVAVCDIDPISRRNAQADFPGIRTYDSVDGLLAEAEADLVCVITPHNTHAPISLQCLRAGKHVLVDKPMATSVADCTAMIDEARRQGRSLAVFHNRRHDGNYRAIKALVDEGRIGEVFHVECCEEQYGHPGHWWYSRNDASGGVFFFWGPHAVDWVLNLVPSRVKGVAASAQKRVWLDVDIDDEIRATLFFENGATAQINFSYISPICKPLWRILGTKGATENLGLGPMPGAYISGYGELLEAPPCGTFTLVTVDDSGSHESEHQYWVSDWLTYYKDLAAHLLKGAPIPVSGEEGRRAVAVMEAAGRSARSGRTEPVAYG